MAEFSTEARLRTSSSRNVDVNRAHSISSSAHACTRGWPGAGFGFVSFVVTIQFRPVAPAGWSL